MAVTPGAIDVTRGRGEFGRGFYTQTSIGNAFRRGFLLYGNNRAILAVNIDDRAYHVLNFLRLSLNEARRLNARLRATNTQDMYTTRDDVIAGPLVRQPRIMQQKFQTMNAEALLNGPLTQRVVRP
jgi:hypothetical protein